MPRNITVTFADGTSHVYQNAPDNVTADQVSARAQQEFHKQVHSLDGGRAPRKTVADRYQPRDEGKAMAFGEGILAGGAASGRLVNKAEAALAATISPVIGAGSSHHITPNMGWVDRYRRFQHDFEASDAATEAAHSGVHAAGTVTGAVFSPLNKVGAGIRGAGAVARFGRFAAPALAYGAVAGGGDAHGNALQHLQGAATGAGASLAGGALGHGVGRIAGKLAPRISEAAQPLVSWAVSKSKMGELVDAAAARRVFQRIAADAHGSGPTAHDMIELRKAMPRGKPLTLMDVGGENIKAYAGRLARTPGESRSIITDTLVNRQKGTAGRLEQDVAHHISAGNGYESKVALAQSRGAAAKPLYEAAYAHPSIHPGAMAPTGDIGRELNTPLGRAAMKKAYAIAEQEHVNPETLGFRIDEGGEVTHVSQDGRYTNARRQHIQGGSKGYRMSDLSAAHAHEEATQHALQERQAFEDVVNRTGKPPLVDHSTPAGPERPFFPHREEAVKVPTWQALDYIKRGMDDVIETNRDKVTGKLNLDTLGRAQDQTRTAFRSALRRMNPSYGKALDAFSGPSASMDAVTKGQGFVRMRREELRDIFKAMPEGEREFFKLGVADAMQEKLAKFGKIANPAEKDYMLEKVRPLFGSEKQYRAFVDSVESEYQMMATKQHVIGGSPTAPRVAEDNSKHELATATAKAGVHAAMGNPLRALAGLAQAVNNRATSAHGRAIDAAAARLLTSPANQNALRALTAAPVQPQIGNNLGRLLGGAGVYAGAKLANVGGQ